MAVGSKVFQAFIKSLSKKAGALPNAPEGVMQLPSFQRAVDDLNEQNLGELGEEAIEFTPEEIFNAGPRRELLDFSKGTLSLGELDSPAASIVDELMGGYKMDEATVKRYLNIISDQRSRLPEGFTPLLDLPNVKQSTDDFLRDEMFDLDDIDDIDDLLDQVSLQDRFEAVQSMGGGADMIRQELKETYSLTDDFISDLLSKEGFQ